MTVLLAGSDSVVTATLGHIHRYVNHWYGAIGMLLGACVFIIAVLGMELFKANAIQFGLD